MEDKQKFSSRAGNGKVLTALLFISAGILLFAYNVGIITYALFNLLVAWHSLFILAGIYTLTRKRYMAGSILLVIGAYMLCNSLMILPFNAQLMHWPLVLVLIGIFFLRPQRNSRWEKHKMYRARMAKKMMDKRMGMQEEQQCQMEDGFLNSDNSLGAVRQVVLDEVFKGADIRNYFGGTTIDLRHTHLAPGKTYINIDCKWGGVELFIPAYWNVQLECNCFCGGCEDKRWKRTASKQDAEVLVIRGNITFGGLEIKD